MKNFIIRDEKKYKALMKTVEGMFELFVFQGDVP